MIQIIQKESEQIWCLYYQNATRYLTIRLKTSVKTIRLSWRFLFLERGDLLAKTKIKVIRCYDGTRPYIGYYLEEYDYEKHEELKRRASIDK